MTVYAASRVNARATISSTKGMTIMDDRDTSIALLRERVSQLEAALKPFADGAEHLDPKYMDPDQLYEVNYSVSDYLTARAALSPKQEEG